MPIDHFLEVASGAALQKSCFEKFTGKHMCRSLFLIKLLSFLQTSSSELFIFDAIFEKLERFKIFAISRGVLELCQRSMMEHFHENG